MNATAARPSTARSQRTPMAADEAGPMEEHSRSAPEAAGAGSGRDSRGRFTAANAGGPGNPFARQTAQLRSALIQRVTIEDINVIADELILRARCGQLEAIKLLFQYVIGKPTAAVNPDTLDVEEFQQVYAPRKEIMEVAPEIAQGLPPHVLSTLVQVTNDACGQQMAKILSSGPEGIAKAQKNLGAFFGGAKDNGAARPETQEDADAAEAAAVWRILNGEEDDAEAEGEEAPSPSTKRLDGKVGSGHGQPPSGNGHDGTGPSEKSIAARGARIKFPAKPGGGMRVEKAARPPSTNGKRAGPGRSGPQSGGDEGGRRRA